MKRPWVIGITGASGVIYGIRLSEYLLSQGYPLHFVISDAGWRVLNEELGWQVSRRQEALDAQFSQFSGQYIYHPIQDIGASTASGSYRTSGMVVVPCSMGTLSGIAQGASNNLLQRTADVMLKEGRKLIIVPRETPLHAVHLSNMLTLAQMGTRIIPAMPGFYNRPTSLDEVIDFMVGKILDAMDIDHELYRRWGQADETKLRSDSRWAD